VGQKGLRFQDDLDGHSSKSSKETVYIIGMNLNEAELPKKTTLYSERI